MHSTQANPTGQFFSLRLGSEISLYGKIKLVTRVKIIPGILVLCAVGLILARDSVHQQLADWTGEEDWQFQLKGLGYLALSAVQPPRNTADLAPMKYADVNPFGVNTFLEQEVDESKVRQSLALIRDAGFHWIRQEFPWEDIEIHGKGDFQDRRNAVAVSAWSKYDRIVNLASEYGLEIVARLDHPPAWTRKAGRANGDFAPPDNFEDYADFVAAVVARYQGRVRFIQIWNEPNVYPEWGEQNVDPRAYTRLLQIAYARAKSVNPDVVIISAGLTQTTMEIGRAESDLLFLQEMYDAGARGSFDILAVNDYGLYTGPGDRRAEYSRTNFSRPILMREIMVKNGDANKPVWAMEMGWNTTPDDMDAPYGRVTEQNQARYATQAYVRSQNEWPWMGAMMYWFLRRVDDRERDQPFYYFRLLDPDFSPRPVYSALKDYIGQTRVVTPGFRSTSHWAMNWGGSPPGEGSHWQVIKDEHAYFGEYKAGQVGDSVSFVFQGTDLDLVALQNPYGGAVQVQVDSLEPRTIELWRTDTGVGGRITLAHDMADIEHRVMLTVARAPVAINGFVIQRSSTGLVRSVFTIIGVALFSAAGVWFWKRGLDQQS